MPAIEWFSDDKHAYSTALMFAYINMFKPERTKLALDELEFNLEFECWAGKVRPIDVLNDLKNKKYKDEVARIKKADTSYPIIVDSSYRIVDGVHRYAKHVLEKKRDITVYVFDKALMKKFVIGKRDGVQALEIHDLIELFYKRFR